MARSGSQRSNAPSDRTWVQTFRWLFGNLMLIACLVFLIHERATVVDLANRVRMKLSSSENPSGPVTQSAETIQRVSAIKERVLQNLGGELKRKGLEAGHPIYLRAFKEESLLELWMQKSDESFHLFRTYEICSWSGNLGPKLKEGDKQTPEGFYYVTPSRMNPNSRYHLSFNIGFPNRYDQYHGRTGSHLMIHGSCVSIGCLAMTDEKIEEIYTLAEAAFEDGQRYFRVHMFPFRMTDARMARAMEEEAEWLDFWINLKLGFDYFEIVGRPPNTELERGEYVFE